ncbi:MAG TPA: hypothetical protein PKA32_00605 [Candidatus Gracilibacteria bacterium]|nr:hypothetical protein [Candidatus Gracilibacteria bacterium]
MNIQLSWDLFILAFFGVVIAYSFIIGRNQTLKVISATYLAILCSDALGNLFSTYLASSESFLKIMRLFSVGTSDQATAFFKVLVLITFVVLVAVRGLYNFDAEDSRPVSLKIGINLGLGLLSAGLMMSALMIFVAGESLIAEVANPNNPLTTIYGESRFARIMIDYSNLWFFLPGAAMVLLSMVHKKTAGKSEDDGIECCGFLHENLMFGGP